ncbi:MAG: Asp-tRNA(Asn)/Glu-tRNA(Gln) amidotransferase subunit GatC [Clostridia bacterium]
MKISREEVTHIAELAKLKFTDEEIEKLSVDLESIVGFANQLDEVNVDGVKPTAHILNTSNVFRKDCPKESFERAYILKNAPSKEAGCISVPKVVAEEE